MESRLAFNTDTKISTLDYYQIVFLREVFAIFLEKILLREMHLSVFEKVNKRGNCVQLHVRMKMQLCQKQLLLAAYCLLKAGKDISK